MRSSFVQIACLAWACGGLEPPPARPPRVAVFDERLLARAPVRGFDTRDFVPVGRRGRVRVDGNSVDPASTALIYSEDLTSYESQFVPSDTRFAQQWSLAAIGAPAAWDSAREASDVVVAVIDSGVALEHPDLVESIWINEREEPGNGLDDDENGYVDDVFGWDFVDDDPLPLPDGSAASRHGTHVAGIIGAGWDDGRGVAGIAPHVRLMALRALAGGRGYSDGVADAVDYATENGAAIINLSLGGTYSRLLDEALTRAARRGVVVVAAAGNDGRRTLAYPAASSLPNVVGVGASDKQGEQATFSNVGTGLDVLAPGVDILSTVPATGFASFSGTSMAAPHVTGALALALSRRSEGAAIGLAGLLARLPRTPTGVARLDLPALLGNNRAPAAATLAVRRSRLTFNVSQAGRPPPPQTISIAAPQPTEFTVRAPPWVRPGTRRTAPGKLSFTIVPSSLGAGAHVGEVVLASSGTTLRLAIEVFVGDLSDQALELTSSGTPLSPGVELAVAEGTFVDLRANRAGMPAGASWKLDGEPVHGVGLRGIFARSGRHEVEARDPDGRTASVTVVVSAPENSNAAPALGLPGP